MVGFPDEAFAELANQYSGIEEFFTDVNVSCSQTLIPGQIGYTRQSFVSATEWIRLQAGTHDIVMLCISLYLNAKIRA